MTAEQVEASDNQGLPALKQINLNVRRGEILGVAGVAGNGQAELAEVMTGLREPSAGIVRINGSDMSGATPREFTEHDLGHIPDRHNVGLVMDQSIEANAVVRDLWSKTLRVGPFIRRAKVRERASRLMEEVGLDQINTGRPVGTLSGGQMQRLLVRRELDAASRCVAAVHPTRGLDVAAAEQVHQGLLQARDRGVGVLLVSEDLDEILKLSDRVAVLYEGRIAGELDRSDFSREQIGALMGGLGPDGVASRDADPGPANE